MVNVVLPMAGRGSRFAQVGYTFPKPLIDVNNKPMIQVVVDNLNIPNATYFFLVLKEHYDRYALKYLLPLITRGSECRIIVVDQVTEGAACTVLLAKDYINSDEELILANSDQWVNWRSEHFLSYVRGKRADGGILTFNATHPKWSFAKVDEETNLVTEVAEKKPISNIATVGIYYFKKGSDFVAGAEQMMKKDIRTNGEFYVCPVFNELIGDGKKVYSYPTPEMKGLGTPEDLRKFLGE
jgi:NDP-sugar pyrophosphorylase family protein